MHKTSFLKPTKTLKTIKFVEKGGIYHVYGLKDSMMLRHQYSQSQSIESIQTFPSAIFYFIWFYL